MLGNVVSLTGNRILFTGTNPDPYQYLGNIVHQPMISINPLNDYSKVDAILSGLNKYNWIIFTSRYSVDFFMKRIFACDKDVRIMNHVKIASIGSSTTKCLSKYALIPDLEPSIESSKGLAAKFRDESIGGQNILIPRSNMALAGLPDDLKRLDNEVSTLIVYNNEKPMDIKPLDLKLFSKVFFTSRSSVFNFSQLYERIPDEIECLAIGDVTARACQELLGKIAVCV